MWKKINDILYSPDITLREKFFLLGGAVGVIALFVVFMLTFGTAGTAIPAIVLGAGLLLVLVIVIMTFRTKQITIGGSLVVLFICCVALPIGYILGGAAHSGSPVWFVLGILYIFMVFEGKLLALYVCLSTAAFGIATFIAYRYPDLVVPLSKESMIYFDTFFAALTVALLVGFLLKFTRSIYERQAKEMEEKNLEIERLNEAQNTFFSSMSHEIRTPINTIIGLDEMILRDTSITEEVSENAQNIQNASKILLALINDILDLSKIQSGRMEVVPAQYETSRMFSDIVNLLWTRAKEKGLDFDVNVGDSIPSMLYGDEMRLKQVIINLLTNAIKYTSEGGVTLNVDGEKKDSNTFILKIDVIDTGMGIKKENIPYLFDSFRRVEQEETKRIEGTGLGLSISKQLVELMGGKITVDSIYTKGSTFHVDIEQKIMDENPMSFQSIKRANVERPTYEQSFEAPDAHVLIVDDNDMNRMVSRKLLRGTKVQTDLAASGKECLEKTTKTHYDAIFMDHEMPDMDGVETLTRVRAQQNGLCRNTPVIALTANAGSDMNDFYISHGFQAYLAKPIHGSLLEATLLQFLPPDLIERSQTIKAEDVLNVSKTFRKKPLLIAASSVCDLPRDFIDENFVKLMPYYVVTEEGRFRDISEIDSDNLFDYMKKNRKVSATAGSVEEYEKFFGEALSEAETVLYLSASKEVSDGYQNAVEAAESFGDVIIYDTGHLSSAFGLIVRKAAELAKVGLTMQEIVDKLDEYRELVGCRFIMPELGSTIMKENVPLLARIMSKAFSFEPVIRLKNGKISVAGFHAGYVTGAAHKFIRNTLKDKRIDPEFVVITYSGCSVEMQQDIVKEVKRYGDFENIYLQKASATVAASSGLNSFGLVYQLKEKR